MSSWKEIKADAKDRFVTEVQTPLSIQVSYPNVKFTLDESSLGASNCWIYYACMLGEDMAVSCGNYIRVRTPGIIQSQIHTPLNTANAEDDLQDVADYIRGKFQAKVTSVINYKIPNAGDPFREDQWWRMDVFCPFYADRLITP